MSSPHLMANGKLATQSSKIVLLTQAAFDECCCCPLSLTCEEDAPTGYGWHPAGAGVFSGQCMYVPRGFPPGAYFPVRIYSVFIFDDSSDCGGNDYRHTGTATLVFDLASPLYVTTDTKIDGNVETEDAGYDESRIAIDGIDVVTIVSTETDGGCTMEPKTKYLETPILLSAGCHKIEFKTDTGDGAWHQNMRHDFDVFLDETSY